MKTMSNIAAYSLVLSGVPGMTLAATMDVPFVQTGGFYADGGLDNSPTFQNYFIGYGTTPGFPRTPERRHFFVFDLTGVTVPIVSAELSVILPFGGLIADEPMETWVATGPTAPAAMFMDTGLTPAEAIPIFAEMGGAPEIIDPVDFGPGDDDGVAKPYALNATGVSFLNSHLGGMVAISGYMASWSPEPEIDEGSELIFGFTDVVSGGSTIDAPVLTVTTVPEPATGSLLVVACGLMLRRRKRAS